MRSLDEIAKLVLDADGTVRDVTFSPISREHLLGFLDGLMEDYRVGSAYDDKSQDLSASLCERSYDCLMENVTTWRMRHAPCVQWSSSGNVIRKSTFHGSDAQWHAGWTQENLYELCTVDAKGSWGTYGHGGWASPPHDKAHGPEGPRNVIYNCDFRAPKTGLWMGGMNENWLILHNRFVVEKGPGIVARRFSFDHIVRGNVIAVKNTGALAIQLVDENCTGTEIEGNRAFVTGGKLVGGKGRPAVEKGNSIAPYRDDPPRPTPVVLSIFEWQRRQRPPTDFGCKDLVPMLKASQLDRDRVTVLIVQ